MQSPVADLSPVAQAGRKTGEIYRSLLESPEGGAGAIGFLGLSMYRDLSQGGTFDYQREANPNGGYTQLPHYRNVSNFNVGLYSQQAGLTLHETLSIAGIYARFGSSNARPEEPYALHPDTRHYTEYGYEVGRSGLFGTPR